MLGVTHKKLVMLPAGHTLVVCYDCTTMAPQIGMVRPGVQYDVASIHIDKSTRKIMCLLLT